MAEYIEHEAVMATANEWEFSIEDFDCFVQALEQIPAADVAPVVHGRWIARSERVQEPFGKNYDCSECGHNNVCTNYCPNCGTKMDGGKHETN